MKNSGGGGACGAGGIDGIVSRFLAATQTSLGAGMGVGGFNVQEQSKTVLRIEFALLLIPE